MLEFAALLAVVSLSIVGVVKRDTPWGKASLVVGLIGLAAYFVLTDAPSEFVEGFRDGYDASPSGTAH